MALSCRVAIELFVDYLLDPRYGLVGACQERFGLSPQAVFHEGNSVLHSVEYEGDPKRRPLTYDEVQALFDAADARPCAFRGKAGRHPHRAAGRCRAQDDLRLRHPADRVLEGRPARSVTAQEGAAVRAIGQHRRTVRQVLKGAPPKRRSHVSILWNQICQACVSLPCRTSAIGRRVVPGASISRDVGPAGRWSWCGPGLLRWRPRFTFSDQLAIRDVPRTRRSTAIPWRASGRDPAARARSGIGVDAVLRCPGC